MKPPVIADVPTGVVEVFIDGLQEGAGTPMPLVWMALLTAYAGVKLILSQVFPRKKRLRTTRGVW